MAKTMELNLMNNLNVSDPLSGPEFFAFPLHSAPMEVAVERWDPRAGYSIRSTEGLQKLCKVMHLLWDSEAPSWALSNPAVTKSRLPEGERETARLMLRMLTALRNDGKPPEQRKTELEIAQEFATRHQTPELLGALATPDAPAELTHAVADPKYQPQLPPAVAPEQFQLPPAAGEQQT